MHVCELVMFARLIEFVIFRPFIAFVICTFTRLMEFVIFRWLSNFVIYTLHDFYGSWFSDDSALSSYTYLHDWLSSWFSDDSAHSSYTYLRLIEFVIFQRLSAFVIYTFPQHIWFVIFRRLSTFVIDRSLVEMSLSSILRWLFRFVICRWSLSSWFFDDSVHLSYIKHSLKICHGSRRSHLKIITTAKIYNKFSWESPYILNMFPRESPKFQTGFNMSQWSARYSKEWTGKPSKSGDPNFSSVISSVSGHSVRDVQMTS